MNRASRERSADVRRRTVLALAFALGAAGATWPVQAAVIAGGADVAQGQFVREFHEKDLGVPAESVTAAAIGSDGNPWLVAGGRLIHQTSKGFEQVQGIGGVSALIGAAPAPAANGAPGLLAGAADGVWYLEGDRRELEANSPPRVDLLSTLTSAEVWAVVNAGSGRGIWSRSGGWKKLCELDAAAGKVRSICRTGSGVVLAATERGVFKVLPNQAWTPIRVVAGGLLSGDVSQLVPLGAQHSIALTPRGISLTDGSGGWESFTWKDGLPIESLSCASVAGESAWFGSEQGAVLWRDGRFSYFAGRRWLPDDHVTGIAAGDHDVWIATRGGLSHILEKAMTLADKAEFYQRLVEDRPRRLGYVTVMHLRSPGDFENAEQEISDNDGLWTAMYVCAESFRYAVSHSPEARQQAHRSMDALLRLESITGISGFPARAISDIHDPAHERRSGGQWHPSPVEKDWMWKGDTSSDEIVGHYLAFYVYCSLVADDQEKPRILATCRRMTDHILDHGYYLVDITGKPTTWGYWRPERLNGFGRGGDRGLNSLEILSHLKVAIHLLGDERYKAAYRELIEKHHYALNTVRQRVSSNGRANHSDDELAFLSYYPLLLLETDPSLRAVYESSLRRTWEAVRPEACPLWNFMYGACAAEQCDVDLAVEALREIPLDLVRWPTNNAGRSDLRFDPTNDRFGRKQLLRPLPWSERPMHTWNGNPYRLDAGDGREEEDPTFWLLPYWLGRYHHLIN